MTEDTDPEYPTCELRFTDPNTVLAGERCSKLIDPYSPLYEACTTLRHHLVDLYGDQVTQPQRMMFHVELVQWRDPAKLSKEELEEDERVLVARARQAQSSQVTLKFTRSGKAISLDGPVVEGYGLTHITLAHFKAGPPPVEEVVARLRECRRAFEARQGLEKRE